MTRRTRAYLAVTLAAATAAAGAGIELAQRRATVAAGDVAPWRPASDAEVCTWTQAAADGFGALPLWAARIVADSYNPTGTDFVRCSL